MALNCLSLCNLKCNLVSLCNETLLDQLSFHKIVQFLKYSEMLCRSYMNIPNVLGELSPQIYNYGMYQ